MHRGAFKTLLIAAIVATIAVAPAWAAKKKATPTPAAAAEKTDVNSASQAELEKLPGVGKSTAAKIIAGRPYASTDDLAKAGISKSTIKKIGSLITFGDVSAGASSSKSTTAATKSRKSTKSTDETAEKTSAAKSKSAADEELIDLNTATQKELEGLPGVGKATAKKIIDGRPYKSADDLAAAGISKSTIAKITPLIAFGKSAAKTKATAAKTASGKTKTEEGDELINLNTASEKELIGLPGVGKATAKKIIAGRPYKSVDDLAKAGVSKSTIGKITSLVSFGEAEETEKADTATRSTRSTRASSAKAATEEEPEETAFQAPPSKGMVWVNLESKIYHYEGDRWYGNTKNGKYMSEADAIKAGYRASKTGPKQQ